MRAPYKIVAIGQNWLQMLFASGVAAIARRIRLYNTAAAIGPSSEQCQHDISVYQDRAATTAALLTIRGDFLGRQFLKQRRYWHLREPSNGAEHEQGR